MVLDGLQTLVLALPRAYVLALLTKRLYAVLISWSVALMPTPSTYGECTLQHIVRLSSGKSLTNIVILCLQWLIVCKSMKHPLAG